MPKSFWIKRLITSFVVAFGVLTLVQILKGAETNTALLFGLVWGGIAAAIFTGVGYYKYRRNPACMTKID